MQNEGTVQLFNIYLDESGGSSLGEARYKFFLISSVILSPEQRELAGLLLFKWRKKYLINPNKCFHSADFFEDFKLNYKKKELKIRKNYNKALNELIDILHYIDFKAVVYYVDLHKLRIKYSLVEPPSYKDKKALLSLSSQERMQYKADVKNYELSLIKTVGEKNKFLPLKLVLKSAFSNHFNLLLKSEQEDINKRAFKGFINFESLSGNDTMLVAQYHQLKGKIDESYENKIIGINFINKNSEDAGIELADLIAYVSFQNLRFKHRRITELANINAETRLSIKKIRKVLRGDFAIQLMDVTDEDI